MRKFIIFLIVFLIFSFNSFCQSNTSLKLIDLDFKKDSIQVKVEIVNNTGSSQRFYVPAEQDICLNILKIKFKNIKTEEVHEIIPCDEVVDLDSMDLTCCNSISLKSGEGFTKKFHFNIKQVSPFLQTGKKYSVSVELNFDSINFNTSLKNVYSGNLNSDQVLVEKP